LSINLQGKNLRKWENFKLHLITNYLNAE